MGEGQVIAIALYNPSLTDEEVIQLYLNTSKVLIEAWYPHSKVFEKVTAEAICYLNPDYPLKSN
jgi:hypothetical protein